MLWQLPLVSYPFWWEHPLYGVTQYSQIGTTKESKVGNYLNTLMTEGS